MDNFRFDGKNFKYLNRGNISIDDLHYDIDNDPRFTRCDNQEDAYQELLKLFL